MKKILFAALTLACSLIGTTGQANASVETLVVPFSTPSTPTINQYYDWVRIDISGSGQSLSTRFNDAFYLYTDGPIAHDGSFYQLNFGTSPLAPFSPARNAENFLVGPLPAYNSFHTYSFYLNTGTMTPTLLHFGVSDGIFSDNTGAYTITVGQVPEPSSLALIGLAFLSLFAFSLLRRSNAGV
ncbi:MAG: PEP-CTERM sorting domain-containing protein [Alphaproteobacteria bacterium]|nr:PEP-CTERM sorting domain-containing protein [Alphaproteobacteria bacterium]